MSRALNILAGMTDDDLAWLSRNGRLEDVAAGKALIHAGQPITSLIVLLAGSVEIVTLEGMAIDRAGPGDVLGEMSLIEDLRPSVVVHTLEPSRMLVVPHQALNDRLEADDAFAARFYRSAAAFLSTRLRGHMSRLGFGAPVPEVPNSGDASEPVDGASGTTSAPDRVVNFLASLNGSGNAGQN